LIFAGFYMYMHKILGFPVYCILLRIIDLKGNILELILIKTWKKCWQILQGQAGFNRSGGGFSWCPGIEGWLGGGCLSIADQLFVRLFWPKIAAPRNQTGFTGAGEAANSQIWGGGV
jgi:hypothetical protein